jgi:hypothetical protein
MNAQRPAGGARLRRIAALLVSGGMLLFAAQWCLVPELNPLRYFISEYAIARFGFLTMAGFCLAGAGVGLTSGIVLKENRGRRLPLPECINLVFGILVFLLAFFPTDSREAISVIGTIHRYCASIAFPGFLMGYILLVIARGNFRGRKIEVVVLAVLTLAFFLLTRNRAEWRGLYQRVFIYGELILVLYYLKNGRLAGEGI